MACEAEESVVQDLSDGLAVLHESLQNAIPGDKPGILARIDALRHQLSAAKVALGECMGQHQFISTLTAESVSIQIGDANPAIAGPYVFYNREIELEFLGDDRDVVVVHLFPVVQTDPFDTPIGQNSTTVTLVNASNGTYVRDTGEMMIHVSLYFDQSLVVVGDSTLELTFTTNDSQSGDMAGSGRVVNADAEITLVGAGRFAGGFLGGKDCLLTLRGFLSRVPPPTTH